MTSSGRRTVTRRGALAALGTVGTLLGTTQITRAAPTSATFDVRVYPGPMPFDVWLRNGCFGISTGWSPVHWDVLTALGRTMERLAAYADRHSSVDRVDSSVEPRRVIDLSPRPRSLPSVADALPFFWDSVVESYRTQLRQRRELEGRRCHLLLWWDPLNYDLGYGGTRRPNKHVLADEVEGSQTIANVGATEYWDCRAVTRNMVVHETLHTFLSDDVVEEVVGVPCDHRLGSAVRTDSETVRVSPMATAYAGDRNGADTRWPGTGCTGAGAPSDRDRSAGVERWEHTTELSEATLEAVTLYVDRYLASSG